LAVVTIWPMWSTTRREARTALPGVSGHDLRRAGFAVDHADAQNHLDVEMTEVAAKPAAELLHVVLIDDKTGSGFGSVAAQASQHHHPVVGGVVPEAGQQRIVVGVLVGQGGIAMPAPLRMLLILDGLRRVEKW